MMRRSAASMLERVAGLALKLHVGLLVVIAGGLARWLIAAPSWQRGVAALLLLVPALLPLRGVWRRDRRTFAWGTLCLIPYMVVGITELIANPAGRDWAIGCLLLSFGAFVAFIAYLRVSRSAEATTTQS
jgi:uncharacterized membrane protein